MMRRVLTAVVIALGLSALSQTASAQDQSEQDRLRGALAGFVQRNLTAFQQKTNDIVERLNRAGCSVAPGFAADGLPEPQTLVLSAIKPPPRADTIRADEHIDPNSVSVRFSGSRQAALDQDTANVFDISNGVPVEIRARVFRIEGDICELTRQVRRNDGTIVERKERHRIDRVVNARQVNISSLVGSRIRFQGGNMSFDKASQRLEANGPGLIELPTLVGQGAKFENVPSCGQRFVGDTQDFTARSSDRTNRGSIDRSGSAREAVGLVKLQVGQPGEVLEKDLVTGPGAFRNVFNSGLGAIYVGEGNQERFTGIQADRAVVSTDQPGLFDLQVGRTISARPSGPPGKITLVARPAGSTAGSLIGELDLTSSRLELVSDGVRPFIDDDPTVRVSANGPVPADSGLSAKWLVEGPGFDQTRGDDVLLEGPSETPLSVEMPSIEEVINRRGIRARFEVEVQSVRNRPIFRQDLEIFLRPPPLENLAVVGRRKGGDGDFVEGPFDLFRVEGAPGIEVAYRMRHRGGITREVPPQRVPAFGIKQAGSKGLKFSRQRDFPEITADLTSAVEESAIQGFLRQSAAQNSAFAPLPGVDVLTSEDMFFTMNDVLLVIENLGRNGFVWRVLVDGGADMSRYQAQYVDSSGGFVTRNFARDGNSFVAENAFGPNDVVQHVSIVDQDGVEAARISQRSQEAVVPRVSLDVPGVYKQGVDHPLTATISILGEINPLDLACVWKLEAGFGNLAFGSSFLQPIGQGFASCANSVKMDVNEATLGKFPEVEVRLIRIPFGLGQ